MAKEPSVWVVATIDAKFIHNLFEDLFKMEKYKVVESYIPTMKVLYKQVKGKKYYKEVPLLLNYGFFKVPRYFVPNPHFLAAMKTDIRCIYGWVTDPVSVAKDGPLKFLSNPSRIALAENVEIARIREHENLKTIYTEKDLDTLYVGQTITLQCYPFEGLPAKILNINRDRKKVEVKLLLETPLSKQSKIQVSFENIFFTKYANDYIDGPMKEQSIEEIQAKRGNAKNSIMRDGDS
jgi:transcription antitermination factor NusG